MQLGGDVMDHLPVYWLPFIWVDGNDPLDHGMLLLLSHLSLVYKYTPCDPSHPMKRKGWMLMKSWHQLTSIWIGNKRGMFCFAHLQSCDNGGASNILSVGCWRSHYSPLLKYWIPIHYHQFLHTACCFGYYHGISLVYWTRFVKTQHVWSW